jgi:hypothetical protein
MNQQTRERRGLTPSDAGLKAQENHFASEHHFIPPPCDPRKITAILGSSSRLDGRAPMLRKK